jgi:membrane-bound inhibitor of C-type lysozyme
LKVTSGNSCDSPRPAYSDLVTITAETETFPSLNSIVISTNPICSDDQVTFSASTTTSSSISGDWSVGSGGYAYNGTDYTVSASVLDGNAVYFSSTVTGTCGTPQPVSTHTGSLNVYQAHNPTVSLSDPGAICAGNAAQFTATPGDLGSFSVSYRWYIEGVLKEQNTSGVYNATGLVDEDEVKVVMLIDNPVCMPSSAQAVRTITVNSVPDVAANPSVQDACSDEPITITITNPNEVPGTTFAWTVSQSNVSGGLSGTGASINNTLTSTGSQGSATYTITAEANGCPGAAVNAIVM